MTQREIGKILYKMHAIFYQTFFCFSLLVCAACKTPTPKYPKPEKLPSDEPWIQFLKENDLAPNPSLGWEKAMLAYRIKSDCSLRYEVSLSIEEKHSQEKAPAFLPQKEDSLAVFQIEATPEGAEFFSARSPVPFESAPGVLLNHFWEQQVKVPLSVSAKQLKSIAAPRAPWVDLIQAPGASLFFPIVSGGRTKLGQQWREFQELNTNPQPNDPWMPWKKQEPTLFTFDEMFSLHGERLAIITAQWTKDGSWSEDALSPFYQATESGLATYVWLADRGWPLLSEVFVTVSLTTTALDTEPEFYSYTLVGRSSLVQSCEGITLPSQKPGPNISE